MDAYEIHHVYHFVTKAGQGVGYFISDLIFVKGLPIIVFEWGVAPDGGTRPKWSVTLDPNHLHELVPPWPKADYTYDVAIPDPRPLS
jgi:hypothetical protein